MGYNVIARNRSSNFRNSTQLQIVYCRKWPRFWPQELWLATPPHIRGAWWRLQMETFSMLLAICEGNSPVTGEFPTHRPVTRSFDVFFDLHLNKWLNKQSWGWWFETPSRPLWRHSNGVYSCNHGSPGATLWSISILPPSFRSEQ